MLLVPAVYLLLCMPVCLRVNIYACASGAGAHVFVDMLGIGVRADLRVVERGGRLRAERLYERKKTEKQAKRVHHAVIRRLLTALLHTAKSRSMEVYACVGLEDAAQTALVTGALRAALCSAAAAWMGMQSARVYVVPSFGRASLSISADGIFVTSAGDVICALVSSSCSAGRRRLNMRGKKGFHGPASDRKPDGHFDGKHRRHD